MAPERFIPFARRDVVSMCAERVGEDDAPLFRSLAEILTSFVHMTYHARLERMKEAYAPFAQDSDVRALRSREPVDEAAAQDQLVGELRQLLEDANFEPIGSDELASAFEEESLLKIRVHVDFGDFAEVLFSRRGVRRSTETVRELYGLRRREITFATYERVAVYVRFRDAEYFEAQGRDVADLPFEPGATLVKLFQNVPRADLEMLFPNTEVGMRLIDKLILGVPAAVSGVVVVSTKLLGSLGLIFLLIAFWLGLRDEPVLIDQAALLALAAGLSALVGYLAKQWNAFKNRKIQYMKQLSENLYFRNLDNDVGVFFHLLDAAEEEEVKEALLAYSALLVAGPLTAEELDHDVEQWLASEHDVRLDFEIHDALGDLAALRLVEPDGDRYVAVPPEEARRRLDARWDEVFTYAETPV
ncbi:MAG: DUF3754 domain-containing protein [Actinobacteria bacterium]|nr:DUF3754 domain-containing protein [Actinomycetota bacterium]